MKRDERLHLVLNVTERAALRRLAEADGNLSQAALLRRLVLVEAERRGLLPFGGDQPPRVEVMQ